MPENGKPEWTVVDMPVGKVRRRQLPWDSLLIAVSKLPAGKALRIDVPKGRPAAEYGQLIRYAANVDSIRKRRLDGDTVSISTSVDKKNLYISRKKREQP